MAKSSHDLSEIDTRSRLACSERNRHTISAKSTHDLGLEPLAQLSKQNAPLHAFPLFHLRRNTIRADHRTCLQLSNYITSRRTHHEPTLTFQLSGSLQSTCLQLMVQPSLSRAHRTPSYASTNWMHTLPMQAQLSSHQKIIYSSRSQHLTST